MGGPRSSRRRTRWSHGRTEVVALKDSVVTPQWLTLHDEEPGGTLVNASRVSGKGPRVVVKTGRVKKKGEALKPERLALQQDARALPREGLPRHHPMVSPSGI
jgi:hypothetical protein